MIAPFVVMAQETPLQVEEESTRDVLILNSQSTEQTTYDPRELGISVERIPNAGDVVGDFVVGPGKFEAIIQPGKSNTMEMILTNRTGYDRRFNLEIEDATGSSDGSDSVILLGDDRGPYSIKDYIILPAKSFDLKQGERARVPVTIAIPADAEPAGFYGSVLVTTTSLKPEEEENQTGAAVRSPIVQRIGVLFFVTVPGDSIHEGSLKEFSTIPKKKWFEKGPINFSITYENTGVAHLNPYGELRVINMFGEEVGYRELQPWFVLPKAVRLMDVSWNRDMLYGKYTATLYLNRGYDDIIDESSVVFWVIPWKFLLLILGGLFMTLFLIRSFFRKFEFKRKEG
jgi:hypothetical protein